MSSQAAQHKAKPTRRPRMPSEFTQQQMANAILFAQKQAYGRADRTEAAGIKLSGETITPLTLAAKAAGLKRVKFSRVLHGHEDIKDQGRLLSFLAAFRAVIADPGSDDYCAVWEEVKKQFGDRSPTLHAYWFVIPAAYHEWATIALNTKETPAKRLLFGRMAEYVLYQLVHVMDLNGYLDRKDYPPLPVSMVEGAKRGQQVVDALAEILAANPLPPEGLFGDGNADARRRGYRVMKTRLLADQVGWKGGRLEGQDEKRQNVLSAAYAKGMAEDLLWLHKLTGGVEIGDLYHPFVLALHAGEWHRAAEYGFTLLGAQPDILTSRVNNLTPLCDDRTVRPGIAAMLADKTIEVPSAVRTLLDEAIANHRITKNAVEKMIYGVRDKKGYLEVLALGEEK